MWNETPVQCCVVPRFLPGLFALQILCQIPVLYHDYRASAHCLGRDTHQFVTKPERKRTQELLLFAQLKCGSSLDPKQGWALSLGGAQTQNSHDFKWKRMNEAHAEMAFRTVFCLFGWSGLDKMIPFLIGTLGSHNFSPDWLVPDKQALNDLNSARSSLGQAFSKECRWMEDEAQHFYPI